MRTIKVLIAASEELHEEKLEFSTLIAALNKALAPRGIEIERIKWDSETDVSITDFQSKLKDCEMCLNLYWREFSDNAEKELDIAYGALKDGENPRNIYVFFKEPAEEISDTLKDFKANFVTKYGHFFCKYENVDTMSLHFLLQFEAYQNQHGSEDQKLITVGKGKVKVGDKEVVDLDNVPFASLNKEYRRLQNELAELDAQIDKAKIDYLTNPDNNEAEEAFIALKLKRKNVSEEFDKYQKRLYDIALNFAKHTGEVISERLLRAKEAFESGNAVEADNILNIEDMKREAALQRQQQRENDELLIEEFRMKAATVMANTELAMTECFEIACEAYHEAINIARDIHYDNVKLADTLFDFAYLLQQFKQLSEAEKYYKEALDIYRILSIGAATTTCKLEMAKILNNLASLQTELRLFEEAKSNNSEALDIFLMLNEMYPSVFDEEIADTHIILGNIQSELILPYDAEKSYYEALRILTFLVSVSPSEFMPKLAITVHNLGSVSHELHHYEEAEQKYKFAINIRRQLAEKDPDAYSALLACSLNNLANVLTDDHKYAEAKEYYNEALALYYKYRLVILLFIRRSIQ